MVRAPRRGPRPKPTALKVLTGNPGHRPINKNEPKPAGKLPAAPRQLQGEARREWYRTGRKLVTLGIMSEIDRAAFIVYCVSYGRWAAAEAKIAAMHGPGDDGLIGRNTAGEAAISGYVKLANKALEMMQRAAIEFGMTPSARSRLEVKTPEEELDPFEQWERSKAK